ncbi:MAG: NADP-dependent isocitrate dehydrogenase [Xanthomonadales bacterium]|nr:NADP-dependent isocitrate dehydrogenase [Xanthomonadales bacterium]
MEMDQVNSPEWLDSSVSQAVSENPVLTPITVAPGDGIGPEIMQATLAILSAAGARIAPEFIEIGEATYLRGHAAGIDDAAWASLRRTGVLLKGPITTPSGGGYKSLNVTLRKTLGLYANVRPCISYAPFVATLHPRMDVVIVRENEEDLYAGIEHRQTDEVYQCLKLITRPGCEKIVRHAFEYARQYGRRKVTCMVKDNIMKMTDGLFARVFEEIGAEYPDIQRERYIIDIGAARLATRPERFDVIVMPNLYGDILSDIAAEMTGSVGLAGSANIGEHGAMFEAIHGSAPDIAGQGIANPGGLLLAAVMMLVQLRQNDVAERIHNAWLRTLEDGIHTADIASANTRSKVGTAAFAEAVIARLGQQPTQLASVKYADVPAAAEPRRPLYVRRPAQHKTRVGIDIFVHAADIAPDDLAAQLQATDTEQLSLQLITNRGVKVWPQGHAETFCTDHWRCRFLAREGQDPLTLGHKVALLQRMADAGIDVIKTEHLFNFDGVAGYAQAQGQ